MESHLIMARLPTAMGFQSILAQKSFILRNTQGVLGPCSTVQLANLQRGLKDHLHHSLTKKLGLNAVVEQALQSVMPGTLSEATQMVGFVETGNKLETARCLPGKAIEAPAVDLKVQTSIGRLEILMGCWTRRNQR